MQIVFLDPTGVYPPYIIEYGNYQDAFLQKKVESSAFRALRLVSVFFIAVKDSLQTNLGNSFGSFKYIVLGYYGSLKDFRPPADVYLAVFKVVFWVAALGWGTIATIARLFLERTTPMSDRLSRAISDELDPTHLMTQELELDAKAVPQEITVSLLGDLYDQINFDHPEMSGYMSPASRREGTREFTKEQLKVHLTDFIIKVKNRRAFLGTPPAYDVPRLFAFYQQIEDAVRLSIHKVTADIAKFEATHDVSTLDVGKKKEYTDLLHQRARLVIDLAIAGAHCGARFMGEAMDSYNSLCGQDVTADQDLRGALIEVLAYKRKEIAQRHIQLHLGADTHGYTKYMSTMGPILGIPGTKNVVEHLDQHLNVDEFLHYFFKDYTVNEIIDAVQEKVKASGVFRDKIIDWIKAQAKDWNQGQDTHLLLQQMKEIQDSDVKESPMLSDFSIVQELFAQLKTFPDLKEDWEEFVEDLFAESEFKILLQAKFPALSNPELIRKKQALKRCCSQEILGPPLLEVLKQAIRDAKGGFTPVSREHYAPRFIQKAKIDQMRAKVPIPVEVLERVLQGKSDLQEIVSNYLDLERQTALVGLIVTDEIKENGISKELMEWILVSQKILKPQMS